MTDGAGIARTILSDRPRVASAGRSLATPTHPGLGMSRRGWPWSSAPAGRRCVHSTIVSSYVVRQAVAERHLPVTNAMRRSDPALIEVAFWSHFQDAAGTLGEVWPERDNADGVDGQTETDALPRSSGAVKISVKP